MTDSGGPPFPSGASCWATSSWQSASTSFSSSIARTLVGPRMFDPSWDAGCPSSLCLADNMGHLAHLHARRTTLALVSRGAAQEDRGVQEAHGVDDSLVLV